MNKKINNFWNDDVREALRQYIQTEDITIKNKLFNTKLYQPLSTLIDMVLHKKKVWNEERKQIVLIYVYTKVLPKITLDRIVTSQSYIHTSISHHITLLLKRESKLNNIEYNINYYIVDDVVDRHNVIDNKILIIHKLDMMVREQRVINKPNSIFLLLLKEYLLEHDFDCREFNKYVQERMKISAMTYSIISSRLHIHTKLFNEPYIKKIYQVVTNIDTQ